MRQVVVPGLGEGQAHEAAREHSPADDETGPPAQDHGAGLDGIESRRRRRQDAQDERFRGNGEGVPAPARHDEDRPGDGHGRTEDFARSRQAPFTQAHPEDDEEGHQVLQNRRNGGIALLDGGKVEELRAQHADNPEGDHGQAQVLVPPEVVRVASRQDAVQGEQDDAGQDEAGACEPKRGNAPVEEQVLPSDARGAPEDTAEDGKQQAAGVVRSHVILRHRFPCSI